MYLCIIYYHCGLIICKYCDNNNISQMKSKEWHWDDIEFVSIQKVVLSIHAVCL